MLHHFQALRGQIFNRDIPCIQLIANVSLSHGTEDTSRDVVSGVDLNFSSQQASKP